MISVDAIVKKVEAVSDGQMSFDAFDDWFLANSWGVANGANQLSRVVSAVNHVLYRYDADEIQDHEVAQELANAIRPFALRSFLIDASFDVGVKSKPIARAGYAGMNQFDENNAIFKPSIPIARPNEADVLTLHAS